MAATAETGARPDLGRCVVVAIGRNEGERLRKCLESLPSTVALVVYVDSGSSDGSVEMSRARGAEVVELDMQVPFTAARARNAGLKRLREMRPDVDLVQYVDGDCILVDGWLESAIATIDGDPELAVVCGRRREIAPGASSYNRLIDMEWDTPVGRAESGGGDAFMRIAAVEDVGGYDATLIAGEEPELCARLRARGWTIRRIAAEMTFHDAALHRFGQWWKRMVRGGHGYAEIHAMHAEMWGRQTVSAVAWGLCVPLLIAVAAVYTNGVGFALLLLYPVQCARIARMRRARGDEIYAALLYASFCVLGKTPEGLGVLRFWWNRLRRRRARLIEYK
ncbi:MAG: glycosyltransferase [Gemmatimonadaceae bacterium]|nr:glycosyltransferase [Gemmatimonadaceae bacterium]